VVIVATSRVIVALTRLFGLVRNKRLKLGVTSKLFARAGPWCSELSFAFTVFTFSDFYFSFPINDGTTL